jgi:molybdopterin molybdotransferase
VSGQSCVKLSSLDAALVWIDGAVDPLEEEDAPLDKAIGRVLTREIRAGRPIPHSDCAALDGFAVAAEQTVGASSYNPLSLPRIELSAGETLPGGMDAVVPIEHSALDDTGNIVVVDTWAAGSNVDYRGAVVDAGTVLMPARTVVGRHHVGILFAAGLAWLPVVRRPRIRIVQSGIPRAGAVDSNGPMLSTLIERDGGTVLERGAICYGRSELAQALGADGSDIILVVGGTGPGPEDESAAALAVAGEVAIHGVALKPGETAGLGRTAAGTPVVLLPGSPAPCLCCYELFGGRAIRRLGGRDASLPYRSRMMMTARKIVSEIGMTEIVPVRYQGENLVEPIASFSEIGLMAAARADGFVIVPETSEGYPPRASVEVYLYDNRFGQQFRPTRDA